VTFADLLAHTIVRLERAGVPYMVTGSLASTYHGEPRATLDIDIVIDPTDDSLEHLLDGLEAGRFYVDRDAARTAFRERTQFNAIDEDAAKVDFIVRKNRAFSITEFGRRKRVELLGTPGFIVSAEDLVLAKLEWAEASDSERQIRDVSAIVAVAGDTFDREYVADWAGQLGLAEAWRRLDESIRP